ncbi:MAG: hypothetical protein IJP92_13795 [Lachnospiraceae bacterium]|nr:hypothetical protein [Lachnospiraceae bacterium]
MSNNLSNQVIDPTTVGITTADNDGDGKKKRKRMTLDDKIEYYKQQQAEYAAKLKEAQPQQAQRDRKNRTRDLIQIGGVVRKYVPDATTDSTAVLLQRALASAVQPDDEIVAIGNAARDVMPSITSQQVANLLKMYVSLFASADAVRIDRDSLKVIYDQRPYITNRLSTMAGSTVTANPQA